jgi:calpain-15
MIDESRNEIIQSAVQRKEPFCDPEYPPITENLLSLKRDNMKYISWFPVSDFFAQQSYCLFNNIKVRSQIMRDKGYSYLVDSLNIMSTQPGLVIRLFEYTERVEQGVYSIWVNVNGIWREIIVDENVPIYSLEEDGKAKFMFTTPNHEKREIWHLLLEKALAKAYGGYQRLYNSNEAYTLRDLTGAPVISSELVHISENQNITKRELQILEQAWRKLTRCLEKGYLVYFVPRKPN